MSIDWTNWILEKNAKAKEEELKKSDSVEVETLEKAASPVKGWKAPTPHAGAPTKTKLPVGSGSGALPVGKENKPLIPLKKEEDEVEVEKTEEK